MEEVDKGSPMIRMGVSGCFVWLPAYSGSPGPKAIKRLCVCFVRNVMHFLAALSH